MPEKITSIKHEKIIEARELNSFKVRQEKRKLLVFGKEAILWAISSKLPIECFFIHEEENFDFLKTINLPVYLASDGILKKLTDTSYLIPFVAMASFPKKNFEEEDVVIVLDNVVDFGNIGTIVRTAKAFGIENFVSTRPDFDLFYKKTIDASRGAVFETSILNRKGKEAIEYLKKSGYQIIVTTPHKSEAQSFTKLEKKKAAIVFGNEAEGVSEEIINLADIKVQIPMVGMESLNVAVAAGISIYELKIKVALTMLYEKIKSSWAKNLYAAARWNRLVFDKKLKESTPFTADQAIMMMIVKCDEKTTKEKLFHDAGCDNFHELEFLMKEGYLIENNNFISIPEKGEEALAKIWIIGEQSDKLVFENFSEEEQKLFNHLIDKILKNCSKVVDFS